MKKFKRIVTVGHILSTFWSLFYAYYMLFRSLGIQESNASNDVQIGVETKKLWPFEDNRIKLWEISQPRKFRSPKPILQLRNEIHLRNFARCFAAAKPPASTRVPLRKLKLHLRSCEPRCEITSKLRIKLQIISKLWNHLQVAKSKFKLAKWTIQRVNHLAKSTCAILDICNRLS